MADSIPLGNNSENMSLIDKEKLTERSSGKQENTVKDSNEDKNSPEIRELTPVEIVQNEENERPSETESQLDPNLSKQKLQNEQNVVEQDYKNNQENVKKGFVTPLDDPLEKAHKYLAKHMLLGLFQGLTAGIAYSQPKNPLQYMINEIEQIQEMDRRKKGMINHSPPKAAEMGRKTPTDLDFLSN